ncbi:peptide methionine sulfoxide reductase 2 [[Candida] railenensis]|uniref:Peptide-methionine (R)-S-oxide reductase n=1 Tax=[Candida] railenensis TaxID=45579 RepID=A0A9P0VXT2_9ASCO|nr:peptide methionine sulfoxide reductase 2 [[Candida] railenensis]
MFRRGYPVYKAVSNSLVRKHISGVRVYSTMSKTEEEWRAILSPAQFKILRQQGTEAPYSGEYTKTPASEKGVYSCAGCSQPLYKASTKFSAHCGWPAFYSAIPGSIRVLRDESHGMVREEMRCSKCDGHLGHIFKGEGYKTPTDERHCVNSISLKLDEKAEQGSL